MLRNTLLLAFTLALASTAAFGGPILDDILNYMYMDQSTPMEGGPQLFKMSRPIQLTKDAPLGQTFITGAETEKIVRVRVFLRATPEWQPGEGARLELWDSPEKKVSLGQYSIWYEYRGYKFEQAEFEINSKVKPNTSYYFEISYVGDGDGVLGKVGVINGKDGYAPGQGYLTSKEDNFDLCFQTHAKRAQDRTGNLKKAFARFDLSRPELSNIKQAVDKEDFDTAIKRTVEYFEARQKPVPTIAEADHHPAYKPDYDPREADLAMKNYFYTTEAYGGYAGPDLNWHADPSFDAKGNKIAGDYDLNVYGSKKHLLNAYLNTGNEKYAKKYNDMMLDWFLDNPAPPFSHIGGNAWDVVWTSLNVGSRIGQAFYDYTLVSESPSFTTECRFGYLLYMADHGDTLVMVGGDAGGNWSFTQNSKLLTFALNFPEYTNSKLWTDTASQRLAASLKKDFLPDGVETESAPGYQRFAYTPVANVYELLRDRNITTEFTGNLRSILEKEAEYFMFMAMPNGINPWLGDWGADDARPAILRDAKRFDRKDMLFVATGGKEGAQPNELAKLYPYAGIATMRSDWGDAGRPFDDARYLMLHGVHFGAHGHSDLNSIAVYAYGRQILSDPGSYFYGSPEHALLTTSPSHNLMTIDGLNQRGNADAKITNWLTTPVADHISSWVDGKDGNSVSRDVFYIRGNGDTGVQDYWVVRDTALGGGEHLLEQRWHFNLESAPAIDNAKTTTTSFPEKGNLAIFQVEPARVSAEQTGTNVWWPRSATSDAKKMPTVIYKAQAALPFAMDTALIPFEGKSAPKARTRTIESSPDGMTSAFAIVQGKVEDVFVIQKTPAPKSLSKEKIAFDGERIFVRRIGGKVRSVALINGSTVSVDGKQIVKLDKAAPWIAVSFDKSGKKVYQSK